MQAIWLGTVLIDNVELIGAMVHQQELCLAVRLLDVLAEEMPLTANMRQDIPLPIYKDAQLLTRF